MERTRAWAWGTSGGNYRDPGLAHVAPQGCPWCHHAYERDNDSLLSWVPQLLAKDGALQRLYSVPAPESEDVLGAAPYSDSLAQKASFIRGCLVQKQLGLRAQSLRAQCLNPGAANPVYVSQLEHESANDCSLPVDDSCAMINSCT